VDSDVRLDVPPDPSDTASDTTQAGGVTVSGVGDDGGASTMTWVLVGLVAIVIAAALVTLVMQRTRRA